MPTQYCRSLVPLYLKKYHYNQWFNICSYHWFFVCYPFQSPSIGTDSGLPGAVDQVVPLYIPRYLEGQSAVSIQNVSCGDLFVACLTGEENRLFDVLLYFLFVLLCLFMSFFQAPSSFSLFSKSLL